MSTLTITDLAAARALCRQVPSFHDFVEDALFHPQWGYYATGAVAFGDGGHYDTFPIALSPLFGRMVVQAAFRRWRACGRPRGFDLCEIGAGNGQLCVDALVWLDLQATRYPAWNRFRRALQYRIVEKSPALRRRQRAALGAMAARVAWEAIDLSRAPRVRRRGRHALVIANEVLDCLTHHKVVRGRDGAFRVTHVGVGPEGSAHAGEFLTRRALQSRLAHPGAALQFTELLLPLDTAPRLRAFMETHYPDQHGRRQRWVYFAQPAIERFVANIAALYDNSEVLLIDYGGERDYHLRAPASARLRAGRPEDGASPYRAPGRDDITFLVDFSVVQRAARASGFRVHFFGGQGELARRSGVRLDAAAADLLVRQRAAAWLLALAGVGPESRQRRTALTWRAAPGSPRRRSLRRDTRAAIDAFLGRRSSVFHLLVLRKDSLPRRRPPR